MDIIVLFLDCNGVTCLLKLTELCAKKCEFSMKVISIIKTILFKKSFLARGKIQVYAQETTQPLQKLIIFKNKHNLF